MSRLLMSEMLDVVRRTEFAVRAAGSDLHNLKCWLESEKPPTPEQALELVRAAMASLDKISQ